MLPENVHTWAHTNNLHSRERHCRRIIWRFGNTDVEFTIYAFNVVTYGDRPASTILEVVKRIMVEMGVEVDEETARLMGFASYMDDCMIEYEDAQKLKKFLVFKSADGKYYCTDFEVGWL